MRLSNGLALAGFSGLATAAAAAASHEAADVFILANSPRIASDASSSAPQIPRQLARHIMVQRLGGETELNDLPESLSEEDAVLAMSQFGRVPRPLLGGVQVLDRAEPSQLLVVLEGMSEEDRSTLEADLKKHGRVPAFSIADTPSSKALDRLVNGELAEVSGSCQVALATNPYSDCWNGMSLVVKYDVAKDPDALSALLQSINSPSTDGLLHAQARGELETTLVLLPESTRHSQHAVWSPTAPTELRRRFESPLTDTKVVVSPASGGAVAAGGPGFILAADPLAKMNLGCFTSYNSCVTATGNCTGHGSCADRYAVGGKSGDRQCFVCSCTPTKEKKGSDKLTHWGGAYCQKIDVSSPFWLLAGTSIILVGLVTGCIALLFSVGEEKLPGVIGAGVSRSK